jgi:hypothetical protein
MIAIEQRKVTIIRVFEDGKQYGDEWVFDLVATYCGKYGKVVELEGLQENVSIEGKTAIRKLLLENGVKEMKWNHTNDRGVEKETCLDIVNNKLRHE